MARARLSKPPETPTASTGACSNGSRAAISSPKAASSTGATLSLSGTATAGSTGSGPGVSDPVTAVGPASPAGELATLLIRALPQAALGGRMVAQQLVEGDAGLLLLL